MKYDFLQIIYLATCFLRTCIFYSPARLIRFPIDIRGYGSIAWGTGFTTGKNCRLETADGNGRILMKIGCNVQMNDNVHIVAAHSVIIGDFVLMASKIFISDCAHGDYSGEDQSDPEVPPALRPLSMKAVVIGDRVWIGDNVVIMPGVTIGSGSIIGASSVVTTDIPPNTIAVGTPARVVKRWENELKAWVHV